MIKQSALRVLEIEQRAIAQLAQYIDDAFVEACQLILPCKGKIIVCGMGKSGHIGHKISATLASTGTPAFFMHPAEANHGDLGMLTQQDILLAISNSGETAELLALIPVVKRMGVPIIAMTSNPQSTLGKYADINLCIKVEQEACSLGLAPTSSTTATLVMGDALAVALLDARGFTSEDFALSHPGGSLGRKLFIKLEDVMVKEQSLPLVSGPQNLREVLLVISQKALGMAGVIDDNGRLLGIFTDGDLRRVLDHKIDIHQTRIQDIMTLNSITAKPEMLAAEVLTLMQKHKISSLFVTDPNGKPIGAINMQLLLQAGII
ncbi:KpsF/GutQ family sugar-phosphate isomerase [Paraglaciecola psychrophila]|uniref:Arabinose 5-phosphate isomerase n=1 Tax=Paraglaciecola psychrophila 170 TaxID=1129794 RepID=K6Z2V7_9ALTE|nr:KpsF/GutQ family sugar-phosphate isomerase [Paraglaciecola psychrophila]AGH47184.1 KpsF/GutQ family protein [Paraglaciecola psychrophila 170]GAC39379.1 arabinose 5-phosphate isomerase [Paraglaciecola psychrophila 170]